jgi:hypothetical protein
VTLQLLQLTVLLSMSSADFVVVAAAAAPDAAVFRTLCVNSAFCQGSPAGQQHQLIPFN